MAVTIAGRRDRIPSMSLLCWLAVLLALAACSRAPVPLEHDAYVWQRAWQPSLVRALRDAAPAVRQWRVLAAEAAPGGRLITVAADRDALRAAGRPVTLVVRIDGQLPDFDEDALLAAIADLRRDWIAGGIAPAGLEIDHDCGTSRLPAYARFLARLRRALNGELPLSVTALPAWLESPQLDAVLGEVDEAVLQVHAVRTPAAGLFDADLARTWIDRFAARSPVPFRVALPTYGSRVDFDVYGNPVAVTSEAPPLRSDADRRELMAQPAAVGGLLARLRERPVPGLRGIAWFRLPTGEDARAWSPATWRAVMAGRPLAARLSAYLAAAERPGLYDLVLENSGDIDAPWPTVDVGPGCSAGDGVSGYLHTAGAGRHRYDSTRPGLFQSHKRTVIGWLRCSSEKVTLHVSP